MEGDTGSRYDQPIEDYPVIDNVMYFPGTTPEFLSAIRNLPVRADDVFVATYPKSGTTWVSEILWQIYHDGMIDERKIGDRISFIEFIYSYKSQCKDKEMSRVFQQLQSPRIIKTHLQYQLVPGADDTATKPKFIYVIRNPRDCAVSFYHHYCSFRSHDYKGGWNEFFEYFIRGTVDFGSWFDHVRGWWTKRDDPNFLFLKYEDMKKDLPTAVSQIADFTGKKLSPDVIRRIADQTTFDAMKDKEQFSMQELLLPGTERFLRKGQIGDWRNHFTEEQSIRFDEIYKKKMCGLELEF